MPRWLILLTAVLAVLPWRRNRCEPMPLKFEPLAGYNAECYHGIMHTPEQDARMAVLQREFNAWLAARN